jgi:radical SAM protein with 4Fe4S-binding SPASM domain
LLTSVAMVPFVDLLFRRLGVSESTTKSLVRDQMIRKSMLSVVKGIVSFGIRYPQPTGAPIAIVWNVTNRCNLNCIHCHQDSSPSCSDPELTTQEAFEVIGNMSDAGLVTLTFSGGEPLLRKDLCDLIKRADDSGLLCTIASNGTLMTAEKARELAKAGIRRVEIGLDGARPETHDFLRNRPGSFDATVEGIRNCAAQGFDEIATTMTLHSKNISELQETIDLAERLGATRFYLNRLIPAGRGVDVSYLDVTPKQKVDALRTLYAKFYRSAACGSGMQCYARGMTYYARLGYERSGGRVFTVSEALSGHESMFEGKFGLEVSKIVRRLAEGFGGCSAGLTYAGLTASGDLLPCVPAAEPLGNLLTQSLEGIWVRNPTLNHIRNRKALRGTCGVCVHKHLCGGCRYTAYVATGDWLGSDASCPYGPAS